ncbi:MAG: hypothetical protein J6V92_03280 [Bacteroidaceae bacterium]|nr:hypothetical protein [Bacteroidaceae bacterium]
MEILAVIGILLVILMVFIGGGLLGWVLKGLGVVFDFLWDGCSTSLGCLFWVVVGFLLLASLVL